MLGKRGEAGKQNKAELSAQYLEITEVTAGRTTVLVVGRKVGRNIGSGEGYPYLINNDAEASE